MEENTSWEEKNTTETENNFKEGKTSWENLRRVDSMNLEAGRLTMSHAHHSDKVDWRITLSLAFQSIGVVYGDIGTSPLYVYGSTFTNGIGVKEDILGVLSLIIYTIILLPLLKYVFIVLRANDNGDGGTFALYSLLARYAKVSLIPNDQPEDRQLSNYSLQIPSKQLSRAENIKNKLENSKTIQLVLFLITILGTSMVIGDGILTPCISVLSAVGGIKSLGQDAVVGISIAILVILFSVQRFGTDKVGLSFAPIIVLWFLFISVIGLYNLFKYDLSVLGALNPKYMFDYFKRNGKQGWISLGGVVLCVTGAEAMFADLGHFNVKAIQISFSGVVFPALLCAYAGQAAYLTKFPEDVSDTFYKSIPGPLYWPTFVVAVAAAIIASQAMISGAFTIISQSLILGCFPRVKVVHTSAKYEGQVYIPEVNYLLMIACVLVCWGFRTTEKIGNAYGIAVVAVMVITTFMVTLIMLVVWKTRVWWIALFFAGFFFVECTYLSSVLYKFKDGGYLPLALSFFLMIVMGIWHYVHKERYMYDLKNKVSSEYIRQMAANPAINRIPGMGLLYSELVQGIPPIFPHFIANVPSIHSVLVFVSIKSIPISKVALEERFLFRQVEPREYRMFRCVVRYGYKDAIEEPQVFERQLVEGLKEFIRHEHFIREGGDTESVAEQGNTTGSAQLAKDGKPGEAEMQFVHKAMEKGVVYLLGEAEVVAEPSSSLLKKFVVNHAYAFLRNNSRQGQKVLEIPKTRILKVGMTYEI
ncbi:potassium transporter 5 [Ricinus communis]|uniref:Potassium transporter n=1 Tax=Ricinus communis TaxID=3988 RepID=B9RF89_RICCO|nr:potassium transporter 5 [Ricinus communis]EEF49860.1 Potassium transporter, putative [Ricinus communis]|eukprot:XP_002512408.1 potassium transporter 5 [Ricinus communis]